MVTYALESRTLTVTDEDSGDRRKLTIVYRSIVLQRASRTRINNEMLSLYQKPDMAQKIKAGRLPARICTNNVR